MTQKHRKPAWWQLIGLLPLMLLLLIGDIALDLPSWAHEALEIAIVLAIFGAMLIWVHINARLLNQNELEKGTSLEDLQITVYEPTLESPEGDSNDPMRFEIPSSRSSLRSDPLTERKGNGKWQLN